jgi:hypothetical protein
MGQCHGIGINPSYLLFFRVVLTYGPNYSKGNCGTGKLIGSRYGPEMPAAPIYHALKCSGGKGIDAGILIYPFADKIAFRVVATTTAGRGIVAPSAAGGLLTGGKAQGSEEDAEDNNRE